MCVVFAKATHIFFSKNVSIYVIFNDQSFNDTLTNDIISFEQLGPEFGPQREKRGLIKHASNEASDPPAHTASLIRVFAGRYMGYHYDNKPIQIYWIFCHQNMKIFR